MIQKEKTSWEQIEQLVIDLEIQIKKSKKKYDYIIGINRGGLVPSVLLSHKLNVPHGVYTVQSYVGTKKREVKTDLYISMIGFINPNHEILIVDDIADSGESLEVAVRKIKKQESDAKNIDTATIYYKPKSIVKPTFFAKEIPDETWVIFPWESY